MNRRLLVAGSAAALIAVGATGALAAWSGKSTSAPGKAAGLALPKVVGVSAPSGAGSTSITWTAATFTPGITGYLVQRYATQGAAIGTTVCANAATSCPDNTVGTFWYGVTALYKPTGVSWSGPESDRVQATISAASIPPSVAVTKPTDSQSVGSNGDMNNNCTAIQSSVTGICGTDAAGSNGLKGVSLTIARTVSGTTTYWNGNNSWSSSVTTLTATTNANGWYYAISYGTLTTGMTHGQSGSFTASVTASDNSTPAVTGSATRQFSVTA